MSLMKKIKDILFEEEEYTEPIKIREEKKKVEDVKSTKIEIPLESEEDVSKSVTSERELFTSNPIFDDENPIKAKIAKEPEKVMPKPPVKEENSFQFPDFDEEEFKSSMSRSKQNTNVLEYERKKNSEKREYNRYERGESRLEPKEPVDKKKFKPSPIISPVYGILNQDYKAEDIINKSNDTSTINIEEVRKKAFETKKEEVIESKIEEDSLDPVVTFFEEKDKDEEKEQNDYKTIDSLLSEAAEEIPLEDTLEIPKTNNLDAIEEELEKIEEETKEKSQDIDDTLTIEDGEEKDPLDETLDSDLFELIDSMYDEREEG